MTTYSDLVQIVSRRIGDSENATFTEDVVKDFIQDAMAEIGRVAPERFQEDIDPVEDTLTYQLRADEFDDAVPEIELYKVEVWEGTTKPVKQVPSLAANPSSQSYSNAGWFLWGGVLNLPNRIVDFIQPDIHLIRVWGYSPYVLMEEDDDPCPLSNELQQAMILYCRVQAMEALISDRVLFKQWQTRSNNADVSPAGLMNEYQIVSDAWRRKSRAIFVIRELPD